MVAQANLEYQTFWAPQPLSRPRCVGGQAQSRPPVPQPKSSPLPRNDNRGMIGVPKESLDLSRRSVSGTDDFIYISDDAGSDIDGGSPEPVDETLPSVQAIAQSLTDAEETGKHNAGIDDCDPTSQHENEHEVTRRSASYVPCELENTTESLTPPANVVAARPVGASTPTPRIRTSMPTSIVARSQTDSPSCDSSLSDAASPQTRCTSMSADSGGMEKTSTPEIPCRVDSELHSRSQPQPTPSPLDHGCTRVGTTPKELLDHSQGLAPAKDESNFGYDDAASNKADASCDKPPDEKLPSVQAAVQSFEEPGKIGSIGDDCQQMSKDKNRCEVTDRPTSSPPSDHNQADQITGMPSMERANSPIVVSPSTHARDTIFTQTKRTCSSAAGEGAPESHDAKPRLENNPTERFDHESSAPNHTRDPLTSRMHMRLQNKRRRELLTAHDAEQSEMEGSPRALDDPEYCPSTNDESEDGSDSPSGDEAQPSSKRRKLRTQSSKLKSRRQRSVHCESAGLDQASEPISAAQEDVHAVAEPTDAAFDEWILQDVVLKRTIMDGKVTFLFQFDWDLCAKHGQAARKPRKRSKQQGQVKPIAKNNERRRFTASEDQWLARWKEEEGLCWAEIHSRFCAKFEERSKEALQVRYCTRLKQKNNN
ncbi:hypothetical protein MY8738_009967 [Beauveria namnaoensis]